MSLIILAFLCSAAPVPEGAGIVTSIGKAAGGILSVVPGADVIGGVLKEVSAPVENLIVSAALIPLQAVQDVLPGDIRSTFQDIQDTAGAIVHLPQGIADTMIGEKPEKDSETSDEQNRATLNQVQVQGQYQEKTQVAVQGQVQGQFKDKNQVAVQQVQNQEQNQEKTQVQNQVPVENTVPLQSPIKNEVQNCASGKCPICTSNKCQTNQSVTQCGTKCKVEPIKCTNCTIAE